MTRVKDCVVCTAYRERRATVLAPAIAARAFIRGVVPTVVAIEYIFAVHRRHQAGLSLSTRTFTPVQETETGSRIRVHRSCNGCGKDVGDANRAELDAAVEGRPLPDVRIECGCYDQETAA